MKDKKQTSTHPYKWRFFRSGGFDQVQLETGKDLLALDQLDQKLWAALSCPTRGLEMDTKTLDFLDADKDGRIRVPEILAEVKWAGSILKNINDLTNGDTELPLSAINDETDEGKQLLASAKQILINLGKADAKVITTDDTKDPAKIFAHTKFNGDGIITENTTDDENIKKVIKDIMECLGSESDRSSEDGISIDKTNEFFSEALAFSDWWLEAENDTSILPFADKTTAAVATFEKVKTKVNDYFTRCRLAAFDERSVSHLNSSEKDYETLATNQLSSTAEAIAALPLATVEAGKSLPLDEGLNPAWVEAISKFKMAVVAPSFGDKTSLTEQEWLTLLENFSPYEAWLNRKTGTKVEKLELARIREILAGKSQAEILALIEQDKSLEAEANAIVSVDKLLHYYRDLFTLLNNFVSLKDFYTRKAPAVFQAGTLYLDGRSCELCVRVDDMAKHGALANLSGTYLAYCTLTRKGSDEKLTIAAAFTGGDSDNLMVGRNGIFYDRKGIDWDATIVKIIEHPISICQAFWSPYKRIARMISEQAEKMASSREKAMESKTAAGIATAGDAKAPPFDVAKFAGIFAALGLAVGAIATALTTGMASFMSLPWWQMPLAILGLMVVISTPSVILAWLKLRQRNLAPILDANGWAVNTRAKINIPFGTALTGTAALPKGAKRSMADPFAVKKKPWKSIIFLALLVGSAGYLWYKGYLNEWYDQGYLGIKPLIEQIAPDTAAPVITAPKPANELAPASESAPATEPAAVK